MMKKFFAFVLAFILILGLLPATVYAAEDYYWRFDDTPVGTLPSGFTTAVLDGAAYSPFIDSHFPDGVAAAVDNWSSSSTGDCVFMGSWFTNSSIQASRWLITPALSISDAADVLRWSAKSQDPSYLETYNVLLSTTDNQPASFTTALTSVVNESGSWQQHYIDLSSYTGQTVYIAFQLVSLDEYILLLDNIGLINSVPSGTLAVDAGSDQYVDLGSSATLTASATGGNPPYTYSWSDGAATVGSTASISVTPATDTTYTCIVTDAAGATVSDSVVVSIRSPITATPTSCDFGTVPEGYTAPEAQTVTIANIGAQTVALTVSDSTHFDIGALSASTLDSTNTATFTLQPKTGLTAGTYNETVTVSTDHDTSADISVSFTVVDTLMLSSSVSSGTIYTGGRVTLTPNVDGGEWDWDEDYLSATFNSPATFTGLKAGTTTVTYTVSGVSVHYDVTIEQSELPNTGQGFTWIWALIAAALVLAGTAMGFRPMQKQTR